MPIIYSPNMFSRAAAPTFKLRRFNSMTVPKPLTPFGIVLDELLAAAGWNLQELSEVTDPHVGQPQLSNYRVGSRNPKLATVKSIARAFAEENTPRYESIVKRLWDARYHDLPGSQWAESRSDIPTIDYIEVAAYNGGVDDLTADERAQLEDATQKFLRFQLSEIKAGRDDKN